MRKVKGRGDPDFGLVEKSRAGDGAAFEELLSRHYERMRALIFQLTGANAVDDLTQEVFLLAYGNIRRFRGEAKFSTWLTRIAVNLCRSEWRKRKGRREDRLEDVPREAIVEKGDAEGKSGPAAMMEAERGERIDREIAGLPPRLRIAFTLRYIEGYSLAEVAAILGCREGTVRSRLFNARQILKVRLRDLVE
jgi:RNA polymerase sigma-70 factor (ECF subfamily)